MVIFKCFSFLFFFCCFVDFALVVVSVCFCLTATRTVNAIILVQRGSDFLFGRMNVNFYSLTPSLPPYLPWICAPPSFFLSHLKQRLENGERLKKNWFCRSTSPDLPRWTWKDTTHDFRPFFSVNIFISVETFSFLWQNHFLTKTPFSHFYSRNLRLRWRRTDPPSPSPSSLSFFFINCIDCTFLLLGLRGGYRWKSKNCVCACERESSYNKLGLPSCRGSSLAQCAKPSASSLVVLASFSLIAAGFF